uniref:Uncharacterized protein n=1 Tax=Oryctolagus cuniculus TaxID=9986 RepID=G1TUT3_RABIT
MVQDDHLSSEASCFHWWVIFAVTSNVSTMNIFDRHVLDIETHIVPRKSFTQSFMVHFDGLDFSCDIDWSKSYHHARFENTSLHSAHRDSANVVPLALPSLRVTFHPLNHGILALGSSMLSPFQPEIGTNATVSGL